MTMNKTDLLRLYVLLSVLLQLITENVPFGLLKKKVFLHTLHICDISAVIETLKYSF